MGITKIHCEYDLDGSVCNQKPTHQAKHDNYIILLCSKHSYQIEENPKLYFKLINYLESRNIA